MQPRPVNAALLQPPFDIISFDLHSQGRKNLKITLRLFASYRERVGQGTLQLDVPNGASVGSLAQDIVGRYPNIIGNPANLVVAVNEEYQEHDYQLGDGDEVAFIPPVSGGTDD